ncbi:hypothetical protein QQ045_014111 [Rhodiola kirilowii]
MGSAVSISPSVVTAILVLSITVIVSTCLCLLIRYFIRRCSNSAADDFAIAAVAVSSSTRSFSASIRRVSPQIEDRERIDSLPLFTFASVTSGRKGSSDAANGGDCAVCLSKFEPSDELRLLPICCHAFHAECVDTWLQSNQTKTCPLCRSLIFASEDEILSKVLAASASDARSGNGSFRVEIGNVSRHRHLSSDLGNGASIRSSTYSIGSFDYVVDAESEVAAAATHTSAVSQGKNDQSEATTSNSLAAEVGGISRSWLREYVDRLSATISSRTLSFRSSGRFFGGSDSRNGDYDVEANRAGEEISEMFRWFSSV